MIGGLRPYPAYRDSGVPWLGDVPQHWAVERLKSRAAHINEAADDRTADEMYVALEHVESWTGRLRESASVQSLDSQVKRFEAGDVQFGKLRPYLAKVTSPHRSGVCVGEFLVLRPRNDGLRGAFLERALRSKPVIDAIDASTFGAKMPRADWLFVGSMALAFPPAAEQESIARFLSFFERRVGRYLRAKHVLINLLDEHRQAIVHQAVTRGLDPAVHLTSSSVEWLGHVPEHWKVQRSGQVFLQRNEVGFGDLPILEVSLRTGVRIRDFTASDRKQVMSDRGKYKRAAKGDIAYNMMRMWQGAAGVAPVDGLVSPAYVVARPREGTDSRYFGHLFRTSAFMGEVDRFSRGIVKDRNRLYWEDFKGIPLPYPPTNEQAEIAEAVDARTRSIHESIERTLREVELIREYRARLIADIVTGKFDVREAVQTLPDDAEDSEQFEDLDAISDADEETAEDLETNADEAAA